MDLKERLAKALGPTYEVERQIAAGGMGVVFLARDLTLKRPVAVKVLRPEMATAVIVTRFRREAQHLAGLHHPNLVTVFRAGEGEGLSYYIMEFLGSETLADRLKQGPLSLPDTIRVATQLLSAVGALHKAQVIHRDVKPANIFLVGERVVLGDLGIARSLAEEDVSAITRGPIGTWHYMAPEQRAGERAVPATDLWAAGAVIFECLGGDWDPNLIRSAAAWKVVPWRVRWVLRRALRMDPADRWKDAARMGAALARSERLPLHLALSGTVLVLGVLIGPAIKSFNNRSSECEVLQPSVDLTILPFHSRDSVRAARLARYVGLQLEPFVPIPVRPLTFSLSQPSPTTPRRIDCLNTRYYVEGELDDSGVLSLMAVARDGRLVKQLKVSPAEGDLAWGTAAADSVVRALFPRMYPQFRDVAGRGDRDPRAMDAFYRGQEAFHRDAYREAEANYRRALDLDPGFALAAWHLALARRWLRTLSQRELEELWERHRDALPEQYRLLLAAQLESDLARRFQLYRDAIARYGSGGYAVLLYADELFHRGPLVGIPLDSAVTLMHRAADLDPFLDQAPALDHTVWAAVRLGDRVGALRELERRAQVAHARKKGAEDEGVTRVKFLRLAYWERFQPWKADLARWWLFRDPDSTLMSRLSGYVRLGISFDIPHSQLELGRILVRLGETPERIGLGYEAQGLSLMVTGRPTEAMARFDSAAAYFGTDASALESAEWRLLSPLLGWPAPDSTGLAQARKRARALANVPRLAARALWALALSDVQDTARQADLESLRRLAAGHPEAQELATLIDAVNFARRGYPDSALARTASLGTTAEAGDPFARAFLYLHRAEWFAASGWPAQALASLRWYQNSDVDGWAEGEAQAGDVDGAASAIGRARLARFALAAGDTAAACTMLHRVADLWRDAELSVAAQRDSVTQLLQSCPS